MAISTHNTKIEAAKPLFDYSPWLAELAAREAASMSHMSNADIQYWIDRLTEETSVPLYGLKVSSARYEEAHDLLRSYRRELIRRLDAETAADLAKAQAIQATWAKAPGMVEVA